MNRARHVIRIVGALLLGVAVAGAPALTYAQHSGGGGGGGGGHFSGGGHFGGGGHAMGGGFYGGGHAFAGPHYSAGGHYGGYAGAHYVTAGATHYAAGGGHYVYPGHGPVGHPGAAFAPGTAYWHGGHAWVGGYWNGYYWPHVWFYPGYAWFLAGLPLGYATFWWGGVPYYYWNNLYYTWSPANNGYIVTDPPPVAGPGDNTAIDPNAAYDQGQGGGYEQTQPPPAEPAQPQSQAAPVPYNGPTPSGGSAGDVFLYPRNGQSEAQQQNDRFECHSWAVNQTGFDPTRGGPQSGNDTEYRRAMIACLDARGYSAR